MKLDVTSVTGAKAGSVDAPDELFALVASARAGIHEMLTAWERLGQESRDRVVPRGYAALARAMRSLRPGVVFALAAAAGETDALVDLDSRLFVGLGVDQLSGNK